MALATFSFDVALDSPSRAQLFQAVKTATGTRTAWRLLTRQWMIQFASIADFEGFADALEALHASHPAEFDYFALHFDPTGGPVVIAPNPDVRTPVPVTRAIAAATATAVAPRAAVHVADPTVVLTRLRELHEFDDWEARLARRLGEEPRRRARAGGGARRPAGGARAGAGRRTGRGRGGR